MSKDAVDILLVEDRDDEAEFIELLFGRSPDLNARIYHVASVAEALAKLEQRNFDISLLDLGLPDNVGVAAVSRLAEASPQTPIFVLTGDERRETGLAAIEAGAQDYLPKQYMVGRLLAQMTEHCIARQRRLRTALERSMIDELTGLGNRRGCDQVFADALKTQIGPGREFAVALVDIDNFKLVNDRWGHASGDDVIKSIGEAMTNAILESGAAFRYGGEEFAALLWVDDLNDLSQKMHHLRECCSMVSVPNEDHPITVSVGGTFVKQGETKRDVFERADAALYVSKQAGRNSCAFHDGSEISAIAKTRPPMPAMVRTPGISSTSSLNSTFVAKLPKTVF